MRNKISELKKYFAPNWLVRYLGQEDKLTIQCANFLKEHKFTFHHTFNEGKRSRTMSAKLKGFGVMKGISDFLIFDAPFGKNGMAIELKVVYENGSKNRLSKDQENAQKILELSGWETVTVWSFEEFEAAIKNVYGKDL